MSGWGDILGQDAAAASLRAAWRRGRLPHGLLLCGPQGVGKALAARVLASLFLCASPRDDEPCGACASCRLVAAGTHPDFRHVYRELIRLTRKDSKARDLSIDLIREHVVAVAAQRPAMGRGRAFIIDEADRMTPEASNALLKTLEEPPGRALFMLVTDRPDELLPTILSRCQTVRFGPLPETLIVEQLRARGVEAALAAQTAALSDGSLGVALRWIEDGVLERVAPLAGQLDKPIALAQALLAAATDYGARQIARDRLSSEDQARREGLVMYLGILSHVLRRRLRDAEPAAALNLADAVDAIAEAETQVGSNVNLTLVAHALAQRLRV